jgi:hypothetical protein
MKILGLKVSKGNSKTFGRKLGNTVNTIGRKALNTIGKAAPIASLLATAAGHPEIGVAITAGQAAAHSGDRAIRSGVAVATSNKANLDKRVATFGNDLDYAKADAQHTNALLRQ